MESMMADRRRVIVAAMRWGEGIERVRQRLDRIRGEGAGVPKDAEEPSRGGATTPKEWKTSD